MAWNRWEKADKEACYNLWKRHSVKGNMGGDAAGVVTKLSKKDSGLPIWGLRMRYHLLHC